MFGSAGLRGDSVWSQRSAARLFKDTAKDEVGRVGEARLLEKNGAVGESCEFAWWFSFEGWESVVFHGVRKADFLFKAIS